ncbi:5-methyltetrahydropteroyltriglutamate--homocysteine methyltransferase [Thalassobaculum fulvum]|uniref:5-methyltetrahydropteroyltriglutamate--homocysteine methyltransferase n=1 Tax=Thalassobaculum fulvum TaxID=1633335 RepID=A0A918XM33_9PROT|nr:uroporphyrinogen decarboxylase family protein [Thalassobaculum fulvum]GHD38988.1 5-methyltetrahydropteroyltriglutamate--homocysteine methyltransferase [Thalassobaculum fulvum]
MITERIAALPLLPTTVVGSYPQPGWLVDPEALKQAGVPRLRAKGIWRLSGEQLAEGQRDATVLAVHDMERAGIDIVGDGEAGRESYSNQFATALEGVDIETPGSTIGRYGQTTLVPRVVGPVRRVRPVIVDEVKFLRAQTDRPIKVTLPGPFTMTQQASNEHYADDADLAMAYAAAVNEELMELFAAGADIVQLDEPWMQARPKLAHDYAVPAINRALEGAPGTTAVHLCFGYAAIVKDKPSGYSFLPELEASTADIVSIEAAQPGLDPAALAALPSKRIMLGVIDLNDPKPETAEIVAGRLRAALKHMPAERLIAAPDCGMKYLPRAVAFAKLKAMAEGARIVRDELGR